MKVFQPFRLDTMNHCLWRAEERVRLTPRAFDVLRYLVEHAERLVTQDEILEALWPETYVNPEVIKQYIRGIRKALGDDPEKPAYIETFPRRGYQFIAPVSDESAASSPSFSPKGIVGRKTALAELGACLASALRGQRQLVFVTGEAGIGKTTLVDAFHQQASFQPNLRIARGQCVEGFGGKEAYYPMLEALGQLVRDSDGSRVAQTLGKRAPTWLSQFPSLIKAEQREALQKEILGATRERMVREICDALEALTAESPLILIFEDLHWVDPSTLDIVSAAARRRGPAKLLLLGTYRPTDVIISQSPLKALKQDLLVHKLCREIALERLEESDVAEYLTVEFAECTFAAAGLAKLVHRHSGGNALFMVGIVQSMLKKGVIAQLQGKWTLTVPLEKIAPAVPETLQQLIQVQFEQLSMSEQGILRSASVAGDLFSVWAVTGALEIESSRIEDACEGLAEKQQFIKAAGIHELANGEFSAHYEFRHSLYREVLYRQLSDVNRSKLHRLLGQRLKTLCTPSKPELAAELALHFEGGREYDQAISYLILAAENAARRFAYRDSIELLRHALGLVAKLSSSLGDELETRILEFIGDAHYALGAMAESTNAYGAAASRAAQTGLKAAQVSALTSLMRPFGFIDPDQGLAAIEQAVQVSRSADDPVLLARTQMLAASCRLLYDTWRKEDADLCASAHTTLRNLGDTDTPPFHNMIYAHVQVLQGNYEEAFEIFEVGLPKMNQTTSLMTHFFALSGKTVALLRVGQLGEVLRIVRAGREMAEKNGNDPWLFNFREAWLRTLVLDFDGTRRICDTILQAKAEYPTGQPDTIARIAAGYSRVATAYVELDRQEYDHAIEHFRQVLNPELTPKFFLHWIWRMTAQLGLSNVWLLSGNVLNAHLEADLFLESALSTADPHLQALAWEMKTRVAMSEQDWMGAREYVQQALAIVEKFEVLVAAWQVHATAWQLYLHARDDKPAEANRERAEACIIRIANSFARDEPMRASFLSAPSIARVLGASENKRAVC
jgi:DNA-binding winged helix-turn-helix (wHTH) protein